MIIEAEGTTKVTLTVDGKPAGMAYTQPGGKVQMQVEIPAKQ